MAKLSQKSRLYILFFAVLVVGFYFAVVRMIPGYDKVTYPVLGQVKPFSFTDQEGRAISNKDVTGKVYIAEYFFTTCKGICPKLNTNLLAVYQNHKSDTGFLILSHSVDPVTDSVGRLKHYADSLGVDASRWLFLTGKKDSLYMAARVSYLLDDPKNNISPIEDQFIHTQFFALVDKAGRVRKIIDGLKKDELKEMETDISNLEQESADANPSQSRYEIKPG